MEDIHDGGISGLAFEALDLSPVAIAVTRWPDHRLVYTNAAHRVLVGEFPIGTDGEHGVLAVVMDATEQVATANRLQQVANERRRILRRHQCLLRVSDEAIWVNDPGAGSLSRVPSGSG